MVKTTVLRIMGLALCLSVASAPALAAPRDVMIRSIDTVGQVVELHNFGTEDEPLAGYRFCTHDENQIRAYSFSTGLNDQTIEAGTSIFLHYLNDAPSDPDHINIAGRGAFATPLDNGPYGMQLYFPPVQFFNGATIADHVQWSVDGVDDDSADERSDEAENQVWTDQSAWVVTDSDSTGIQLRPGAEATVLHGPDDYEAIGLTAAPGEVPNGASVPGDPLRLSLVDPSTVQLTWGASCAARDVDYAVYFGTIGDFANMSADTCSTGGALELTATPGLGNLFFLVVPLSGSEEGSYGSSTAGPRPAADAPCLQQGTPACPGGTRTK